MNIVMRLCKWLGIDDESKQLRIALAQADIKTRLEAADADNEKFLANETLKLQSTYCPVWGGNCDPSCAHYKNGYLCKAMYIDTLDCVMAHVEPPRCKLWK